MNIIQSIFTYAFSILNLEITIPINFEGTQFIKFPLYLPFLISGIIDIIIVVWVGIIINRNSIE